MKLVKEYGMTFLKFLGFLLGGSLVISILYYFFFSSKVVTILGMIYLIILFLLFGFKAGKRTEAKGFVAGLKMGLFLVVSLFLINLIFYHSGFKFVRIIYYFILLFSSILGATIGINTKKE